MHGGLKDGARRTSPLSIRARLVLLVLILLVPGMILTGSLLWSLEHQADRTQQRQLAATARTLALVIDGRIGEQVATVQALAGSPHLLDGDWVGFDAQARGAITSPESWVSVRGADGFQFVNTSKPAALAGEIPKVRVPLPSWSGSKSGALVSNVVWNPLINRHVLVVMKPISLKDGRRVHLSVVTPASSYSRLLERQDLPARWTATILDSGYRVVGRNRGGEDFIGREASADIKARMAVRGEGVVRNGKTLDGISVMSAYDRLPGYGWIAIVAMPRDEAFGDTTRTLMVAIGLGTLILIIAVLAALRIGRQIARPVETVATAASDWVAGRPASFAAETGLTETNGLSRAFSSALGAVKERDERQKLLINELNHRVKNTLATVQAVALHTRNGAGTIEEFHAALEGRVIAMSRAHEILTRSDWEGAELGELARQTLSAFSGSQLNIQGPPYQVEPTDALNLALILYELATNASKHGALSTEDGTVTLSWRVLDGAAHVSWSETGGPAVRPPRRKGFGSRLIGRATRDLQPSQFDFEPSGVRCEFTLRARGGD